MKLLKILLTVVVSVIMIWLGWNYLAGPLKYRRSMQSFAASLEQCEPMAASIYMPISRQSAAHTIDGPSEGRCKVRIETLGPEELRCQFPLEDLPAIAAAFVDSANKLDLFGNTSLEVSTSNPDPLARALNSEACSAEIG